MDINENECKYEIKNENKSKNTKKITMIITIPRSLSTITMRTFLNFPKTKVFNDRLSELEHNFNRKDSKNKVIDEESRKEFINHLLKEIESSIEDTNYDHFIIKDMSRQVMKYYETEIFDFIKKHNVKVIYLVRHPSACLNSMLKMLEKEKELDGVYDENFVHNKSFDNHYKYLFECYKKISGKIIISEDLQENPTHVFKNMCEYLEVEFKNEYMEFKPLSEIGIPKDLNLYPLFYEDCYNSTTFRSGVTDISKIKFEDEKINEFIRKDIEIYQYFCNNKN